MGQTINLTRNFVASLVSVLLLSGCTLTPGAHVTLLPENQPLATDARLRVVTNSGIGQFSRPGAVDPLRVVCTEPSPDVAVAAANSFSAGLSILGQGSGSLSNSQVEALASLVERTASIQLLRDKMHQTCLAYANGAITGTTYTLIMSQLDDTIVTLLLGETAGGAFGRSGVALGTSAEGEARATLISLPAGLEDIQEQAAELAAAQEEVSAAQKRLDDAKAAADPNANEEQQAAQQKNIDDRQTELNTAIARREALLELLQAQADTTAKTAAEATELEALGGITQTASPDIARELEAMQVNFLQEDVSKSVLSACLVELGTQRSRLPISGRDEAQNVYENMRDYWRGGVRRADNTALVAAANMNWFSALADFCTANLSNFVERVQVDFQQFRMQQARLDTVVDTIDAQSRWLETFEAAMTVCKGISEANRPACESAVMAGMLTPQPPPEPPPSEPNG